MQDRSNQVLKLSPQLQRKVRPKRLDVFVAGAGVHSVPPKDALVRYFRSTFLDLLQWISTSLGTGLLHKASSCCFFVVTALLNRVTIRWRCRNSTPHTERLNACMRCRAIRHWMQSIIARAPTVAAASASIRLLAGECIAVGINCILRTLPIAVLAVSLAFVFFNAFARMCLKRVWRSYDDSLISG